MIALYSLDTNAELEQIRSGLLTRGIPCICLGPHSADGSLILHTPFVYFHPGCETVSDGFAGKIPPYRIIRDLDDLSPDKIIEGLHKTYRIDYNTMSYNSVRFDGEDFYSRNNYIRLTHSEKSILRLLILCHGMYFTANQIAGFCLENSDIAAVPVHISHINKKVSAASGDRLILSKRYCGYQIP